VTSRAQTSGKWSRFRLQRVCAGVLTDRQACCSRVSFVDGFLGPFACWCAFLAECGWRGARGRRTILWRGSGSETEKRQGFIVECIEHFCRESPVTRMASAAATRFLRPCFKQALAPRGRAGGRFVSERLKVSTRGPGRTSSIRRSLCAPRTGWTKASFSRTLVRCYLCQRVTNSDRV